MVRYKFTKSEFAFCTLFDRRLKASRPNEFNDVFDFTPISDPESLEKFALWKVLADPNETRRLYGVETEHGYKGTYEDFMKNVLSQRLKSNLNLNDVAKWDLQVRDDASNYIGVVCLSRNPCLYLQWSYYADCHKGCAIGLDVTDECFSKARLNEEVCYVRDRPKYIWGLEKNASLNQLREISKTKSEIWKHEREHRMAFPVEDLIHESGHLFVDLSPRAVHRVIYGAQIDPGQKRRIETVLRQGKFAHVVSYQAECDSRRYLLRFKRLQ